MASHIVHSACDFGRKATSQRPVIEWVIIIMIVSPLQPTARHRHLQLLAISLDLRLLASSSCQPSVLCKLRLLNGLPNNYNLELSIVLTSASVNPLIAFYYSNGRNGEYSISNTIFMRTLMAPRSVRFGVRSQKLSNVGQSLDGLPKMYYLELLRASEGTLSRGPGCICSR
jgi:hypothetical protein